MEAPTTREEFTAEIAETSGIYQKHPGVSATGFGIRNSGGGVLERCGPLPEALDKFDQFSDVRQNMRLGAREWPCTSLI